MKSFVVGALASLLVIVGSVVVWELSTDNGRRVGAFEEPSEPIPLSWRGVWSEKEVYSAGQVVSHDGVAYVAEQETVGDAPDPAACGPDCPWAAMGGTGPQDTSARGVTWQGTYNVTRAYKKYDVVQSDGSAWIALGDVPGCDEGNIPCYLLNTPGSNDQAWALLASKGAKGDAGPQGLNGEPGPPGPKGAPATFSDREVVHAMKEAPCYTPGPYAGCSPLKSAEARVTCPPGKVATGGGAQIRGQSYTGPGHPPPFSGYIGPEGDGWLARASPAESVSVYAVCFGS